MLRHFRRFHVHNSEGGPVRFLPAAGGTSTEKAEAGADVPLTNHRKWKHSTQRGHGESAEKPLQNQKGICAKDA